jgi:lysophospholipase L1-like esterase
MNNRIKWLGRLGLLCLGVGMGVVIIDRVDQGYRVHEAEIATRPVFDPPGLKYAQVRAPERDGVRGWVVDMTPPPKRPGVKRVLAVGDSLTWGLGVSLQQAWPARLQAQLPGAEVFNLGMCGYDAEQGVSLITHHLAEWEPDLVIWATYPNDVDPTFLMFGAHDTHPVFVGTSIPSPARLLPEWLSLLLVHHSAMFRSVQAAKLARVLAGGHTPETPTNWYKAQLSELKTWSARTSTATLVLTIPDHTQAAPSRCTEFLSAKDCEDQALAYARITADVSESGLSWVDGQHIYAQTGEPHFMGADRDAGHPTPAGHQVIAAGLVATVAAHLSTKK